MALDKCSQCGKIHPTCDPVLTGSWRTPDSSLQHSTQTKFHFPLKNENDIKLGLSNQKKSNSMKTEGEVLIWNSTAQRIVSF